MSAPTQKNAEQKFWQNPELVEGFLRLLDPAATLQLALAHKKTRSIVQGSWALAHSCAIFLFYLGGEI